jgi:hypothetical protein
MEHAILVYLALALVAYPFLFTLIYEIWLEKKRRAERVLKEQDTHDSRNSRNPAIGA